MKEKWHTRIQLIAGLVVGISGVWMLIETGDGFDAWVLASVAALVAALIWSGIAKVPTGLMFLFSVIAMVFAVIYWPVPKGVDVSTQKVEPQAFMRSIWYFMSFLLFGYLYWFNRKRW